MLLNKTTPRYFNGYKIKTKIQSLVEKTKIEYLSGGHPMDDL